MGQSEDAASGRDSSKGESMQPQAKAAPWPRFTTDSYAARVDAHHWKRSALGRPSTTSCYKTDMVILSGRSVTDAHGTYTLRLDDRLCAAPNEGIPSGLTPVIVREPFFTATPHGTSAKSATTTISAESQSPGALFVQDRDGNGLDVTLLSNVKVQVSTWKQDGTPAAGTTFDWICTLEIARAFPLSG